MEEIYISMAGLRKLRQKLEKLHREKTETAEEIKEALEQGDLKENFGYAAAKEKQSLILRKISELESKIAAAKIIEKSGVKPGEIRIGASVSLMDEAAGSEISYTLVCPEEADPLEGRISVNSPLAQSLLGASKGDVVEVSLPKGKKRFKVLQISYN